MARIESLHVYPVKSCGGFEVAEARLVPTGLPHDREWVLVDEQDRFLTQRDEPRMALLRTRVDGDALEIAVSGEGSAPLRVALDHRGESRIATVWRARCPAYDAGDAAAKWFSGFLGRPVRLVRFDPAHQRLSNPQWTGDIQAPTLFTDGYPLTVLSRASLADLERRVGRELPVNRFRPNIMIDGVEAYAEDSIREIDAGPVTLRLVKPSTRCVITTTDQERGERDGEEPLRTLKAYRDNRELRGVVFAVNAVIVRGVGEVLARGQSIAVR